MRIPELPPISKNNRFLKSLWRKNAIVEKVCTGGGGNIRLASALLLFSMHKTYII